VLQNNAERIMKKRFPFAVLAGILISKGALSQEYHPDFSCNPPPSENGVAVMLCQNSDAAKHELMFDQTYYALRQVVGKAGWKALKQSVVLDENAANQACGLPIPGEGAQTLPDNAPQCYTSSIDSLTYKYRSRLTGSAKEEAERPIDQHILLQQKLIDAGYLPSGTTADGVYGETTRLAIETWQRVTRRPEVDGFISNADAVVLTGGPASSPGNEAASSAVTPDPVPAAPAEVRPSYPGTIDETAFIALVNNSRDEYERGGNDMVKGAARAHRSQAVCNGFSSPFVTGWRGTVETLSSTSGGMGVLSVRVSPHLTLSTTNNKFSEDLSNIKTLIYPNEAIYSQVSNLQNGESVVFSGQFVSNDEDDCFAEQSLTQSGSMEDPEYTFRFTSISPG